MWTITANLCRPSAGTLTAASDCVPSWTPSTSTSTASRIGTTSATSTPPSLLSSATRRPSTGHTVPATCALPGRARSPPAIPTWRSVLERVRSARGATPNHARRRRPILLYGTGKRDDATRIVTAGARQEAVNRVSRFDKSLVGKRRYGGGILIKCIDEDFCDRRGANASARRPINTARMHGASVHG